MKFCVLEKQFDYKGHDCLIVFNHFGYRCGYVSTTLTDNYSKLDIECHGGLTFNGERKKEISKAKCDNYIGFDCGHCWDGVDYDLSLEYGLIDKKQYESFNNSNYLINNYPVCSVKFVEENCKKIVEQLIKLEKKIIQ